MQVHSLPLKKRKDLIPYEITKEIHPEEEAHIQGKK